MNFMRMRAVLLAGAACLFGAGVRAQSPVTLQVDTGRLGREIPPDFCGLSYELKLVLTNKTGTHYFRADNQALVTAFETLGIKHLRVGGNTAERSSVPIPGREDIDSLFGFAKAAGLKVIYTVRMESNAPVASAEIAKYVMDHYAANVSCLTVGNEPDKPWKYPEYLKLWKQYTAVILQSEYAPTAKFCGPSTRPQGVVWANSFATDMGGWEHLAYMTQHDYPRGDGDLVTNAAMVAAERTAILSTNMYQHYTNFYDTFAPAVKAKRVAYRLEEANSYGHGGAVGVSDTYTAALWIIDYLYWWAEHDALGINFHTGEKVMRGQPGPDRPNVYTALTSSTNGMTVLPTGYGMKVFDLGSHGRLVPVKRTANADGVNLAAYGTMSDDKTLCVTVLNKEYGEKGRAGKLSIQTGMPVASAEAIFMTAPKGDITSISGITIGDEGIREDGSWNGKWTTLGTAGADGSIIVTVPAASAVVVRFHEKQE